LVVDVSVVLLAYEFLTVPAGPTCSNFPKPLGKSIAANSTAALAFFEQPGLTRKNFERHSKCRIATSRSAPPPPPLRIKTGKLLQPIQRGVPDAGFLRARKTAGGYQFSDTFVFDWFPAGGFSG